MIPILKERVYENNAISFKTVGFLADAHNCQVAEERNGIFEMSLSYPVESMMFDYLHEDLIVVAKPNDKDNDQLFRIYEITKPINGVVTVKCEHISYELRNYPIKNAALHSITPHTMIQSLIDLAKNNVSGQNSNINLYHAQSSCRTVTSSLDLPLSTVRSALGGIDGSVLDIFGGEYKFDNFDIYFPAERGSDNGVIVAYRKNMTDVKLTTSMESSYTGLFPYTVKDDVYTFLNSTQYPTGSIPVTNNSGIAERILMRDFSSEFENDEEITSAALLAKAQAFLNKNDINALTASMSVSFVNLWQSEEYKDFAPLEKVGLCDTVTVYHEKLGINLKLKVIKTVYDPISERYVKIELGSPKSDFTATITQQQKQVEEAVKIARSTSYSQITAEYQQAIADATAKITGNSGGHVRFTLNASDQPEEITIMNTGDTSTASECWRWNLSGLGYSSSGYSGPYTTAVTADGKINADFIKTGNLSAELITSGKLAAVNDLSYFNLNNGEIKVASSANITDSYRESILNSGNLIQYGGKNGNRSEIGGLSPTYNIFSDSERYELSYYNGSNAKAFIIGEKGTDSPFSLMRLARNRGVLIDGAPISGGSSDEFNLYCKNGHIETNCSQFNGSFEIGNNVIQTESFSSGLMHASHINNDITIPASDQTYNAYNKTIFSFRGSEVTKVEFASDGENWATTNQSSYVVDTGTHTITIKWRPSNTKSKIRITSKILRVFSKNHFGTYIDYNGNPWMGFMATDIENNFLHQFVTKVADYASETLVMRFSTQYGDNRPARYISIGTAGVFFQKKYGVFSTSQQMLDIYCNDVIMNLNGVNQSLHDILVLAGIISE